VPGWAELAQADNVLRNVTVVVPMGKRLYDPKSAFPATTRGNLTFRFTAGAFPAAFDAASWSLEAIELPEASPESYLKAVTISRTSVAGQFDQVLPIGTPLLGLLLFDTGMATPAAADSMSWGRFKLLVDSVEQYIAESDVEVMAGLLNSQVRSLGTWPGHVHQFNGAAAGVDESDEADIQAAIGASGYAYIDLDPLRDGTYKLETQGHADVKLRATGDEATAVRVLPLEEVMVK
jgi:hypothetical protein